jgi:hypothetical protein
MQANVKQRRNPLKADMTRSVLLQQALYCHRLDFKFIFFMVRDLMYRLVYHLIMS